MFHFFLRKPSDYSPDVIKNMLMYYIYFNNSVAQGLQVLQMKLAFAQCLVFVKPMLCVLYILHSWYYMGQYKGGNIT